MFWQEETPRDQVPAPTDVADLVFDIDCRELPVDHAYALAEALREVLPWLTDERRVGIHSVHVAGSQNGWERPTHGSGQRLILSRRTKLAIRAPADRMEDLQRALSGTTLDIEGCRLRVGDSRIRPLSKQATLFARYVVCGQHADEDSFLNWAAAELEQQGIRIRKALCGKTVELALPDGRLQTRSLMLAGLGVQESLQLQRHGLGSHRHMGCGIFIPHKGIDAVKKTEG